MVFCSNLYIYIYIVYTEYITLHTVVPLQLKVRFTLAALCFCPFLPPLITPGVRARLEWRAGAELGLWLFVGFCRSAREDQVIDERDRSVWLHDLMVWGPGKSPSLQTWIYRLPETCSERSQKWSTTSLWFWGDLEPTQSVE